MPVGQESASARTDLAIETLHDSRTQQGVIGDRWDGFNSQAQPFVACGVNGVFAVALFVCVEPVELHPTRCKGHLGQSQSSKGLIPHYFQPSFFSKTSCFPWGSDGFLERRIPGKNGEVSPRSLVGFAHNHFVSSIFVEKFETQIEFGGFHL